MNRLKRKIDNYLVNWKNDINHLPLIVKGARQIGKTNAIENFGRNNYKKFIEINFIERKEFCDIFDNGFTVDNIIKNITLKDPSLEFIPNDNTYHDILKVNNQLTKLLSVGRIYVIMHSFYSIKI